MSNTLKACIVGLGRAGQIHLNSVKQLPGLTLTWLVDTNTDLLKVLSSDNSCHTTTDINEALADADLDVVIIASPTDAHFEYIILSLNAGKHVFTEKPLGHSLLQVKQCFDLAEEKKLALHLGFQRRFDTNFIALKQQLPKLGDCRIIKTSSRDNPRPSIDYLSISGNIFHDMLIHDFDMLCFLFGSKIPETVYAVGHAYDTEIAAIDDYDTVMVTLQYNDGMVVSIDTSRISAPGYDQRIELFGEHGMAVVENQQNHTVKVYDKDGMHQAAFDHSFPERYDGVYTSELAYFAKGVNNGQLYNVPRQECLLSHLIADAALASAKSGEVVHFDVEYAYKMND